MKKILCCLLVSFMVIFASCSNNNPVQIKLKGLFGNNNIDRIVITNTRYSGRYTIVDKNSIDRIKSKIIKSDEAKIDTKLEPDFILEFYSNVKKVTSFKYVAGINDSQTGNIIGEDKSLYHVSSSIEDEFIKRLMKKNTNKNVPEYYISVISILVDKSGAKTGSSIVVDINRDSYVTSSLTSIEQKRILDSIDKNGLSIKFPNEVDKSDYIIKVTTTRFSETSCVTEASIKNYSTNITIKYHIEGTYDNGKWNYYITYK